MLQVLESELSMQGVQIVRQEELLVGGHVALLIQIGGSEGDRTDEGSGRPVLLPQTARRSNKPG